MLTKVIGNDIISTEQEKSSKINYRKGKKDEKSTITYVCIDSYCFNGIISFRC